MLSCVSGAPRGLTYAPSTICELADQELSWSTTSGGKVQAMLAPTGYLKLRPKLLCATSVPYKAKCLLPVNERIPWLGLLVMHVLFVGTYFLAWCNNWTRSLRRFTLYNIHVSRRETREVCIRV